MPKAWHFIGKGMLELSKVQGSMAINGIFGPSTGAIGLQNSFSSGRANIQANKADPLSDDAAKVSIADTDKSRIQGIESAIRYLSPLQSIVDTASSATRRANDVLNKTLDLAKQVATEVDPTKRSVLASDGEALLNELNDIAKTQTPDGVSVVGQGSVSYSVSLDKPDDSKGNSIAINIPDIRISKEDLGLSGITNDSLKNDNEASQDSLKQAISSVGSIGAELKSSSSKILQTAEANGLSRASQGKITEADADAVATKIADAIKNASGLEGGNNLETSSVLNLIKESEHNSSIKELPVSGSTLTVEKNDGELLNQPIVSSTETSGTSIG